MTDDGSECRRTTVTHAKVKLVKADRDKSSPYAVYWLFKMLPPDAVKLVLRPFISNFLAIGKRYFTSFFLKKIMYWLVPLTPSRSYQKERQTLQLSSIGFFLLAQRFNMVSTHWIFFLNVRKRFNFWSFISRDRFSYLLIQYGNVFTFVLLGRCVTVALGVKGNNFILGGKSTVFNAEDAYKVHHHHSHSITYPARQRSSQ
jgi:hypothetical protein